ncbi:hypothetical protein C0995_011562 [Termitomyces sp. Mi166|nr:hypothetical protein C0995_011562 [Termitomyces sp. Mi166\
MSLYSQSHYGQPVYPHYPPPAHHGYSYQYHQLPPQIPPAPVYLDPASFRREYTARLAELTVNSRPIIQNLSMLAQEYSRYPEIVAQCLEAHIRRVPHWMKLPGFYLLDAISKNVYEPYARHFATFVIPLFLETYGQVDEPTRSKMEEMLLTWRTGAPHGKELFGVPPQVAIERGVWGDGGSSHSASYGGSGHVTKAQVLSELEFSLSQKERALQANPYDTMTQGHIGVLHQLRSLVEAGVSQEELQQILAQLRTLGRSKAPQPPVPQPPVPIAPHWQSQPPYPVPQPQSQPQYPLAAYPSESVKVEDVAQPSTSAPAPTVAAPPIEIANLLSTLLKAGVVSTNGTPQGAGATSYEEATNIQLDENHEREASRAYREAILSQPIILSSTEITKRRPPIVEFLYDQLTAQCKQCGVRFADSVIGKKRMEDHLDMHFRQNRKANQNVGRGHSRSWFIGVEDWVQDSSNFNGKGRTDAPQRLHPKAAAAAEVAKRDAELRSKFIIVPPGAEANQLSCPVCKEALKSEFSEEEEDWVWRNAVMVDDRVYHATCHAEAAASTNTLAARLRTELATGRSRSATPEGSISRTPPLRTMLRESSESPSKSPSISPSQLAGTKRKVDEDELAPADSISVLPANPNPRDTHLHATLQKIARLVNQDVEMTAPLSESSTLLVLDTNILIHHFDVLSQFVNDAERYSLPVVVVIPGVVVYELDGQKNRDGLAWFARRASTWLLEKIKERKMIKGQANEETCKTSGNWKIRVPGEVFGTNDALILDCCLYFSRSRRTFICSADKNLCIQSTTAGTKIKLELKELPTHGLCLGIPTISPTRDWSSREIAWAIFAKYGIDLNHFGSYKVSYRDPKTHAGAQPPAAAADSDDMMVVDDDELVVEMPQPSHALDLLHLQVIDHFTRLLIELVGRVGGPEIHNRENGASASRYAPQWQKSGRPYTGWTVPEIWEYLEERRRTRTTSPRVEVFLSKPYSCRGARRGQDWSRRDWDVALMGLARFGEVWEEDSIGESLGVLEPHVEGIFAMEMRPTGTSTF